ncbi:MAG: response regulator transcription factor [Acidipropionibacterium sp.]|nr:response regulator transcription factor [Acidipropionibacterium sp.]
MSGLRILVVDDDELLRDGIAAVLRFDQSLSTEAVETARDGQEALVRCIADPPDVVVMDIRMPRMDGVEATRRIVREHPGIKVLALTTFTTQQNVASMLEAGASGYLVKDSTEELAGAVRAVLADEFYISPRVSSALVRMALGRPSSARPAPELAAGGELRTPAAVPSRRPVPSLSSRESEAVGWLGHGYSNAEIAVAMGVSVGSVKGYLSRATEKLGVRDRVQLLIEAARLGIVDLAAGDRPE